jgi:hypothetical protein
MSSYRYKGVPLTGAVFSELTLEAVPPNEAISRSELVEKIQALHVERGGLESVGAVVSVAKKALADLVRKGRAESLARGYWRVLPDISADGPDVPVEYGEGKEVVYVYYLPAYRDQAAYLGRDTWPMKIGMTKGDLPSRIRDQVSTAVPEEPVIGLIYRTDSASVGERMLHSTLDTRGRRMAGAPGREWFLTNLAEVKEILDFVLNGS